jgi:hypothetical protein
MVIWRHPSYDPAIVWADALSADGSFLLLALGAFGGSVFAMTTATILAHLERIILRKVFATSFDGTSAKRCNGRGHDRFGLKVDVLWVVAHPDTGLGRGLVLSYNSAGTISQHPRRYFPLRSSNYPHFSFVAAKRVPIIISIT